MGRIIGKLQRMDEKLLLIPCPVCRNYGAVHQYTIYRVVHAFSIKICALGDHSSFCQCQKCGSSFPVSLAERLLERIRFDPSVEPLLSEITKVKSSTIPESINNERLLERKRSSYIAERFREDYKIRNFLELSRSISKDNENAILEEFEPDEILDIVYNNSKYLEETGGIVNGAMKVSVRPVRAYEKTIDPEDFLKLECFVGDRFEGSHRVLNRTSIVTIN